MMKAYLLFELKGILANFPEVSVASFLDYLKVTISWIGYINLIRAVSDASPIVGLSSQGSFS